jgi:hypothetical protein
VTRVNEGLPEAQPKDKRVSVAERWYYPLLCAIGAGLLLALSITPRSEASWHEFANHLTSAEVLLSTLGALLACYAVRYWLRRRRAKR